MMSSIRVQEQSEIGTKLSPEGCIFIHDMYNLLEASVTSRALILVVRNFLSPHTDAIYGGVSVSNTPRALILVHISPLYSCWYVIPSH